MEFNQNLLDTSATLARATRVVIHSIFILGPSALGMEESYLWQLKFKEITLQQKSLSRDIGINKFVNCISNYPSRTIETTFLAQFWNSFTF